MTVFKAFFRVSRRYLWPVIMYVGIMVLMSNLISSAMGPSSDELAVSTQDYRLAVLNQDAGDPVSDALVTFVGEQANIRDIGHDERAIRDALFWRDVDYVLRIPAGFGAQVLTGEAPQLETSRPPMIMCTCMWMHLSTVSWRRLAHTAYSSRAWGLTR